VQRLAQGFVLLGRHADAAAVLERTIVELDPVRRALPASRIASLLVDRAGVRAELGDYAAASADTERALALLHAVDGDAAVPATYAAAMFRNASLLSAQNRLGEATPLYEEAIARLEQVHGKHSTLVARHRYALGCAFAEGRRHDAAHREWQQAREIFRDAGGDDDLNAAIVELDHGRSLSIMGSARAEGLKLLAHAHEVFARRGAAVSPAYPASALLFVAEAFVEDGDLAAARAPMEAAVARFDDLRGDPLLHTLAQLLHARFLSECGEYDASTRILEACRAERARLLGAQHPHTASIVNRIGLNHLRQERFELARATFATILDTEDQSECLLSSVKHMALRNLGRVEPEAGRPEAALPQYLRDLDAYRALPASARNALSEASLCVNLGRALLGCGRVNEALPHLQRSVEVLEPAYPNSPGVAANRAWWAIALLASGDIEQARREAAAVRATLAAQPACGIHHRRAAIELEAALAACAQR
jgi:tetratricopeptide (TPR) repeat protein